MSTAAAAAAAAAAVAVVAAPAATTTKAPKAPIVLQRLTSHLRRSKMSTSTKKVALLDYSVCSGRTFSRRSNSFY